MPMNRQKTRWRWLIERLAWLLGAALLFTALTAGVSDGAAGDAGSPSPDWAAPKTMTLKRTGIIPASRHEPIFLNNLDCDLTDYRLAGSSVTQTGCFTRTAFGLVDSDSDVAIFNGTDEGLPLLPYSAHQALIPWPQTSGLLTLDSLDTGGSRVGFYTSPLAVMRDQRDALFRLTAKQMTAAPDLSLQDPGGKPLVINPQAMAFSDNGAWLVAEMTGGAFVRLNLTTLEASAFAPSYGIWGSPALLKSQMAVSDDGNYVAIGNDAASELQVYDLTSCSNNGAGWQDRRCAHHDYLPFARQQIPELRAVRHVRFVNEGLLSFEARTYGSANDGVYELAPRTGIGPLVDYLALGDSFTSGEGAFDYLTGTDTTDDKCHLSANSYPLLLARALFGASGGHSVACSGAVIDDVGSAASDYRGQVRGGISFEEMRRTQAATLDTIMAGYTPGYVAQQRFVRQYQPAVATVSVGGNDVGFGDILENCVAPHVSLRPGGNDCYNTYEDRLEVTGQVDRTMPRWTALFKRLAAEAPGTRLYVVGYPQIVSDRGGCGLNVHLSQSERQFATELTDYLNGAVRQAADKAGAIYVDVSQALAGHRLCEAAGYDVAVNGLTAGRDGAVLGIRVFGHESYHPNALGQALMEQAILKQTRNLAAPAGSFIGAAGQNIFLNAPKTGRKTSVKVPVKHLAEKVLRAGKRASVKAAGAHAGLKARSAYTVRLGGAGGRVIASVTSNDSGDVAADFTLPTDLPAGGQTIDLAGENQAGQPLDLTQPVYVAASDADADGDGVPDSADSCPGAVNSGRDADQDGIDDTCDGLIGDPPLSVGQGGGPGIQGDSPGSRLDGTATVVTALADGSGHASRQPLSSLAGRTSRPAHLKDRPFKPSPPPLAAVGWLPVLLVLVWLAVKKIPKRKSLDYNRRMIWLRKGLVYLLSVVLFVALVGSAAALNFNRDFANPARLESRLAASGIYDHLASAVLQQAEKSSANNGDSGTVSLNDQAVQQAAAKIFTPDLIQQAVNTFLNGNYDWLSGKKAAPDFNIDLTSVKAAFSKQVGLAVQAHLAGLPVCSAQQLAQLPIPVDPLSINCRPVTLDPKAEGDRVAQEVNSNGEFLANPVITANTLNQNQLGSGSASQAAASQAPPTQSQPSQPYYKRLSWLPAAYQVWVKLPWIFGGLAILSLLGVVFIHPRRRHGVRLVGTVFLLAGLALIGAKFLSDILINRLAGVIAKSSMFGGLKQSVGDFLHSLEPQLVRDYLIFGIAFVAVAVVVFTWLLISRRQTGKKATAPTPAPPSGGTAGDASAESPSSDTAALGQPARHQPSAPPLGGGPAQPSRPALKPPAPLGKKPPRQKPPKLIQ